MKRGFDLVSATSAAPDWQLLPKLESTAGTACCNLAELEGGSPSHRGLPSRDSHTQCWVEIKAVHREIIGYYKLEGRQQSLTSMHCCRG